VLHKVAEKAVVEAEARAAAAVAEAKAEAEIGRAQPASRPAAAEATIRRQNNRSSTNCLQNRK
jgi:hypothetical protein